MVENGSKEGMAIYFWLIKMKGSRGPAIFSSFKLFPFKLLNVMPEYTVESLSH